MMVNSPTNRQRQWQSKIRKRCGKKKKKNVVVEAYGQAHIRASFNNLIISLTNNKGEVISWSSSGKQGFRGSKKNTPTPAR
jgi:small subunit ribosomal protein S11